MRAIAVVFRTISPLPSRPQFYEDSKRPICLWGRGALPHIDGRGAKGPWVSYHLRRAMAQGWLCHIEAKICARTTAARCGEWQPSLNF